MKITFRFRDFFRINFVVVNYLPTFNWFIINKWGWGSVLDNAMKENADNKLIILLILKILKSLFLCKAKVGFM